MASRRALALLLLLAAACARRAPVLHVESAAVTFGDDPAAPGRLEVEARFSGLQIDPERPVRLDVDAGARWVRLERVDARGIWEVDGAEHGYRLRLDLGAGRLTAVEPASVPRHANPLRVGLAQADRASCTQIRLDVRDGGWSFDDGRDPQGACVGTAAPVPRDVLPAPPGGGVRSAPTINPGSP